jgi:SAM-dependent methyltransferase
MSLNHVAQYNREIRSWLRDVFALAATISKEHLVKRDCPVCGSSESRFFVNNDYLDYERCDCCSLVYMNPSPPPEMVDGGFQGEDALLMKYFSIISKYKAAIPEKIDPQQDNKLKDIYLCKESGRLLDVGCSVGDFLHKAKFFYDVEGVEINPNTAAIAEKHFKVHRGFLDELSLKPDYDIVTLHQILYGVPDPVKLLGDIYELLHDDGVLYVNTPNSDSYAVKTFQGKANHFYGYTSLNVFNYDSLSYLADKTGFRVQSFRTEWLDIYATDLMEFHDHPEQFIHKRNSYVPDYERKVRLEDELHRSLNLDLGRCGNYIVAVLVKNDTCIRS